MTREEAVALLERYSNYDGMGIPNLAGCKEAMKMAADLLSQPSLPSNLDEAAEEFAEGEWDGLHDNDGNPLYTEDYIQYTFKAGAEWMAGQGVILNLSIDEFSCGAYNACVEQGLTSKDDVIIQVRKKEE